MTRIVASMWSEMCVMELGRVLPVTDLRFDRITYMSPEGAQPLPTRNGEAVFNVSMTYDLEELKHGYWLD